MRKLLILCGAFVVAATASAQAQESLRIDPVAPTLSVRQVSITDMPLPPASDGGKAFRSASTAQAKAVGKEEAKKLKDKKKKAAPTKGKALKKAASKTLAIKASVKTEQAKDKKAFKKAVAKVKKVKSKAKSETP